MTTNTNTNNALTLTIIRGISGSGKSTYASTLEGVICSADDHFLIDGKYRFDFRQLTEAHASCFRKAQAALGAGENVIIDNTNTQVWEMSPYVMLANVCGAEIRIIRVDCDPEVAAERNTHGVPKTAVLGMAERMETPLPFWAEEEVVGPF